MMPRAGRGGRIARAALSRRPVALATAILCLLPLALTAQPVPDEERPRIALVLSGGGARGAAHVGVLKVLEELQIPVDMVVGTSMGSIVGGLYAAGMSPDQIQEAMLHTDWTSAFRDRPPREERYFPRKEDDAEYVVPYELHFASGHPRFPLGLLPAQKLQNLLKYFEVSTGASNDFDELPLPYRAVATDLSNGERVVLDRGSLAVAMRASMSVPGIFPPVPIGDHLLIDGGVSSNLPIEVARELGPAHVIAIDISTPLDTDPLLDSPVSVIRRLSAFLIQGNVTRSGETLEAADLLIRPDLGDVRASRFDQVGIAMELGEAAAREHLAELRRYSVDRETWEAWRDDQRHEPDPTPTVAEIRVRNDSPLNDAIILEHLRFAVGEPLDIDALNEGLSALYGLDLFEPITFEATPGQDGLVLTFDVRRRLTGLTQGLFNLTIEDDFEGGTAYSARMRLQRLGANRQGGEWRVDLGVGQESGLEAEFLQPIDPGLRWFASTEGVVRRVDDYITSDGLRLAQYRVTETTGTLSLGRHLGHWGRARIGVEWTDSQAEIEVPEDLIAPVQEQAAGWFTELAVDTLDAPVWPSRGARGTIRYTDRGDYLGGELEASTLSVLGNAAFQLGGLSLVPGVELQLDLGTASDGSDGGVLGGLFRLSGLAPTEVFGDELVLARVVGYRELGPRAFRIIKPGWFLGGSFEAGNAWPKAESIDLDELILAGSVFIGGDTFAGPVRIGAGFAEGGRIRFFLSVGRGFL